MESGTQRKDNVTISPKKTPAAFTKGSAPSTTGSGACLAVAAPAPCSTSAAKPSSPYVDIILVSILQSLMQQTFNGDVMYLAVMSAFDKCTAMGVPAGDFRYVIDMVLHEYQRQSKSPMRKMFT